MSDRDLKEPTEGEEFVMDFLKSVNIKYEREKKIVGLKGDTKPFRVADFYLPRIGVYIEFFGLWNKNIKDSDYKEKKIIYRNNGIPCVYLYPENLGVIHFSLDKRIQKTLIENGKYKELNKYRWFKFFKAKIQNLFLATGCFIGMLFIYSDYKNYQDPRTPFIFLGSILLYQSYILTTAYVKIFIKNKFSLIKLLET